MGKLFRILSISVIVVGSVLAAALLFAGCGGATQRDVDVSAGEYYAEGEIALLPEAEKGKYCQTLETQRAQTQRDFEAKTQAVKETGDLINSTRVEKDRLERELFSLSAELRTLSDQIDEIKALPTTWRIRSGETLASISAVPEIYNDEEKWWRLFEANKDLVFDPWYSAADTVLVIPRDWPTN
jgi:nucleoid-associated protein YgaU